jgi:hypothetical protein
VCGVVTALLCGLPMNLLFIDGLYLDDWETGLPLQVAITLLVGAVPGVLAGAVWGLLTDRRRLA